MNGIYNILTLAFLLAGTIYIILLIIDLLSKKPDKIRKVCIIFSSISVVVGCLGSISGLLSDMPKNEIIAFFVMTIYFSMMCGIDIVKYSRIKKL